jgi:hypothetical protein
MNYLDALLFSQTRFFAFLLLAKLSSLSYFLFFSLFFSPTLFLALAFCFSDLKTRGSTASKNRYKVRNLSPLLRLPRKLLFLFSLAINLLFSSLLQLFLVALPFVLNSF